MNYIHSTFYCFLSLCFIAIYSFPLFCTQLFFYCCTIVLCVTFCNTGGIGGVLASYEATTAILLSTTFFFL
ncbi:hypothetical protein V8B55DRAFT_1555283, partial [Mucor lusitanicus]